MPKKKAVYDHIDPEIGKTHKLVALKPEINRQNLPDDLNTFIKGENIDLIKFQILCGYDDFTYNEALRRVLPSEITVPSGFETIGNLAHLNLKEPQYPYKYLIGKVILDKTKNVTTVVNKLEKLSNVYRTPILELIGGVKNYETVHNEGGLKFKLDFEKVYWCSRLHQERERVLKQLEGQEVICDAFCGIGPFSLRAAFEHNCTVYASDLNPHCFEYLKQNIKINKLEQKVIPSCGDARDYIYDCLKKSYAKEIPSIDKFYMNLPADAVEFLDVFPKFFAENLQYLEEAVFYKAKVHVYCFVTKADHEGRMQQILDRASLLMPNIQREDIEDVHCLKTVSSEKEMLCVTIQLNNKNCDKRLIQDESVLKKRENSGKKLESMGKVLKTE